MSEKVLQKVDKIMVRASDNPLFQDNDTMIKLVKTILNEEQEKLLLGGFL